jgi:hypothetical protein
VVKIENRFDNVRKRAVSDVVQQRGAANGDFFFVGNRVIRFEFV